GTTTFNFAVGNSTALTSLTTNAGGTTAINGGAVTTTAAQTYGDNVTLGAATILTGVGNASNGTVNGAQALTVNDSGTTTFNFAVGNTTALTSLTTNVGGTRSEERRVGKERGAQSYGDKGKLSAANILTGVGNTVNGTANGAQ